MFPSSHRPPVVVSEPELPSICSPGGCGFVLAVFSRAGASADATPPSVRPNPAPADIICPSGLVCLSPSTRLFSRSASTWAAAVSLRVMPLSFCSPCPTRFPLLFAIYKKKKTKTKTKNIKESRAENLNYPLPKCCQMLAAESTRSNFARRGSQSSHIVFVRLKKKKKNYTPSISIYRTYTEASQPLFPCDV